MQLIREMCAEPSEPGVRRATIFVVDMARYEQL
jgi:hypothetical protein